MWVIHNINKTVQQSVLYTTTFWNRIANLLLNFCLIANNKILTYEFIQRKRVKGSTECSLIHTQGSDQLFPQGSHLSPAVNVSLLPRSVQSSLCTWTAFYLSSAKHLPSLYIAVYSYFIIFLILKCKFLKGIGCVFTTGCLSPISVQTHS